MDINWQPIDPASWITSESVGFSESSNASSEQMARFTETQGHSAREVLHRLEGDLEAAAWTNASSAHNGLGLECGMPNFEPASRAHASFVKSGEYKKAKAIELLVSNKIWTKQRLLEAGIISEDEAMCGRCGLHVETDRHKFYECPANNLIGHRDVASTNHFAKEAAGQPHRACMWYRAIMAGNIATLPVGWAPTDDEDSQDSRFEEWLNATGKVGTDGTGGKDRDPRTRRAYAGAAVISPCGKKVAYMHSKVSGRQTVPRSELTALIRTLRCVKTTRAWTIYIDAQYVINGLNADDRSFYLQGRNGDLWQEVFDELRKLAEQDISNFDFVKVKSHVTTQEQWERYGMDEDKYIYNELADAAAETSANKHFNFSVLKSDAEAKNKVVRIARRLATIEVSTWKDDEHFNKFHGKTFEQLKQSRTAAMKRKVDDAIANTSGGNTHTLYADGRWHRCRDCPGIAHIKNMDYWANKKCERAVKKMVVHHMDKVRQGVKRYLDNPDAEEFNIRSDDDAEEEENDMITGKMAQHEAAAEGQPAPQSVDSQPFHHIEDLLELYENGVEVIWPTGMTARKAANMSKRSRNEAETRGDYQLRTRDRRSIVGTSPLLKNLILATSLILPPWA